MLDIQLWAGYLEEPPVLMFITRQEHRIASRIMKNVDYLGERGLSLLATPKVQRSPLNRDLYELITIIRGVAYKILFTVIKGVAWLLEGLKCKGSTPLRYIKTALQRREQLIENQA